MKERPAGNPQSEEAQGARADDEPSHRWHGAAARSLRRPSAPRPLRAALLAEWPLAVAARFAGYTAALFGLTLSLPLLIGSDGDIVAFKEDHEIEWTQCALVALSAVFLFAAGARRGSLRAPAFLLGLLASGAAVRELDSTLDAWIPLFGWKLPVSLLLLAAGGLAWRRRASLGRQLQSFLAYRAFALLWAGFVVTVPFSQLLGHGEFLRAMMGDDYTRDYKRVIEETGELVGYALILIGSIELLWQGRREPSPR